MSHFRPILCLALAAAMLFSCTTSKITGTTDETVISAKVYNPDHSPAANATIKVFAVNDTTRIPAFQTNTDASGKYEVTVDNGMYNILAGKDALAAFQDSVVFRSTYTTLTNDTLSKPVELAGLVVMQPMDDPQTVTVQILGTNLYSNVSAGGSFTIGGLPPGRYALRSVTTLTEYTATYTWLTIGASAADTVRDTIGMIYTGIPAVKSIAATYDTLAGIVHLSWDTVDYPSLRDFVIYRDPANLLTPSTQPIGTSAVCRFDDHIADIAYGGSNAIAYRVAVRAKDLSIGKTFTDVEVTVVPPLVVNDTMRMSTITLGTPFTLQANVSGYSGPRLSFAWDIGNRGVFVPSTSPETTIVLHDTLTPDYECAIKVLIDNKTFAVDTAKFATQFGWQKVAEPFADSAMTQEICTFVMGGKIFAFVHIIAVMPHQFSLWQSSDGQTWAKISDTLPASFSMSTTKPVVFLNKTCLVDDSGYVWTSADAVAWSKASTAPVCNTIELAGGATLPAPGSVCPPALFVDGSRILLQPFPGTGSQTILSSSDLVTWDSTPGYQMRSFVNDFTGQNGTLVVTGFDWGTMNTWFALKNSSGLSYSIPGTDSAASSSPYEYSLATYKGTALFTHRALSQNIWALVTGPSPHWFACAQGPALAPYMYISSISSLAVLNNVLYLVSTAGIYKAQY
jgi:hypothetical protein